MLLLLFLVPVIVSLLVVLLRQHWINRLALIGTAVVYIVIVILLWFNRSNTGLPDWLDGYFIIDAIGLLFLSIMTIVFAAAAFYSLYYFNEYKPDSRREAIYVAAMLLFVGAMTGVILAAQLALLWVLVEATTLTSAVLIYFEGKKSSLEAAWKSARIMISCTRSNPKKVVFSRVPDKRAETGEGASECASGNQA